MDACLYALPGIAEDGAEGGQDEVAVLVVRALLHEEQHGLEDGGEDLLRTHLLLQDRPDVLEPQFLEKENHTENIKMSSEHQTRQEFRIVWKMWL